MWTWEFQETSILNNGKYFLQRFGFKEFARDVQKMWNINVSSKLNTFKQQ